MLPEHLILHLQEKEKEGELRSLRTLPKGFKDFWSNDYLGIAQKLKHKKINSTYGGATGSRLISGNTEEIEDLEEYLARFYDAESAIIFNSGFTANLSVLSCIPNKSSVIFYDEHIHASMRDGIRLSNARSYSFEHNKIHDLENKLKKFGAETNYIAIESLYSMDGDLPDLEQFIHIAEVYNAYLILDEAHATGVLGDGYKGLYTVNPHPRILARIHTFGKALGTHGAAVIGCSRLKTYLINFARPFIYTTAMPSHSLKEIRVAHELFLNDNKTKTTLKNLIFIFSQKVASLSLTETISRNPGPIQNIFGSTQFLKRLELSLERNKFAAKAIFSPTVPKGKERIRICLHSYNTIPEIDELLNLVKQCE